MIINAFENILSSTDFFVLVSKLSRLFCPEKYTVTILVGRRKSSPVTVTQYILEQARMMQYCGLKLKVTKLFCDKISSCWISLRKCRLS